MVVVAVYCCMVMKVLQRVAAEEASVASMWPLVDTLTGAQAGCTFHIYCMIYQVLCYEVHQYLVRSHTAVLRYAGTGYAIQ